MQWFTDKPRAMQGEKTVTILKSGVININSATHKAHFKDAKNVLFGYDEATNKVAIKPLKEKNKGAYALRETKSGSSASGKGFLSIFDIPHAESTNYKVDWDEELEAVVFELDNRENTK